MSTMTVNERLLSAQCHDLKSQLLQAWRALEYYTGMDAKDAIERYDALVKSVAWQVGKDEGFSSPEEAMPRALELMGVTR